jgi:hypothetical protein
MTRNVLRPIRLLAVTLAVAAGIAGFAPGDTAPAGDTPDDGAVGIVLVDAR